MKDKNASSSQLEITGPEKTGPRCCIITPVGPGHEALYEECRQSVIDAFEKSPGPFSGIVLMPMDDREGVHGRSSRRNDGILSAIDQGVEWIFFLDADDLMLDTAFAEVDGYLDDYDAIWGAIYVRTERGEERLRPNQVMPIKTIGQLMEGDPFLTLQMGHFVRAGIARKVMFDTGFDAGEDFKYYLGVWADSRCIKMEAPLFVNRRGLHSTGPRAADGDEWQVAAADALLDFRISHAEIVAPTLPGEKEFPNGRHIIVTGFPGSGTTMFYNMLRNSVSNFSFLENEMAAFKIIGQDRANMITKRLLDIFNIKEAYACNRFGKSIDIIVLIRDIRGIVTSRHKSVPDDYFIGYDHQYYVPPDGAEPKRENPGVLAMCRALAELMRSDLRGRRIVIRYESLVNYPSVVQQTLAQQFGFAYMGRFDNFHKGFIPADLEHALNGPASPDKSRLSGWKKPEHRERIRTQFTECPELFHMLRNLEYEEDDTWFEEFR